MMVVRSMKLLFAFVSVSLLLFSCTRREDETNFLKANLFTEPPTVDPRKAGDSTSVNVILMLFEGLVRVDEKQEVQLALADRIEKSDDGHSYQIHLREAYWSNGDSVTSEDFLYSFYTSLDPLFPSPLAYKLFLIKNAKAIKQGKLGKEHLGVKALDDRTLEFTLEHPAPYFLELLSFPLFFPVYRGIDEIDASWAYRNSFVSNGPFLLSRWNHDNEMVVVKNQRYWDADSVQLNGLILPILPDTMTEFYLFEQGGLDIAGAPLSNLPSDILPILKKEGRLKRVPFSAIYYYAINTQVFPFNNLDIRKAFALAIHREEIVRHILQSDQAPATSFVPPLPMKEHSLQCFQDNDPKKAKLHFEKGLSDLSLTREQFPPVKLIYNINREHQKIAEAIQRMWENTLGVKVQLSHYDWKVYLSKLDKRQFQIARAGWVGDMNDPISFLEPFADLGENNHSAWENKEYITLLDKAERETHPQKRIKLLEKAEEILIAEMPLIPLYFITGFYLEKPYVKNVIYTQLGTVDFKYAYLEQTNFH